MAHCPERAACLAGAVDQVGLLEEGHLPSLDPGPWALDPWGPGPLGPALRATGAHNAPEETEGNNG